MNTAKKLTGVSLASAAATLLLAGCAGSSGETVAKSSSSGAKAAKVQCSGINSCKGTSACQTATSACKGHNSCKGTGWVHTTKAECDSKGGKVTG